MSKQIESVLQSWYTARQSEIYLSEPPLNVASIIVSTSIGRQSREKSETKEKRNPHFRSRKTDYNQSCVFFWSSNKHDIK
jgi:hypothetical protein